jgi:hypothetical protein
VEEQGDLKDPRPLATEGQGSRRPCLRAARSKFSPRVQYQCETNAFEGRGNLIMPRRLPPLVCRPHARPPTKNAWTCRDLTEFT